MTRNVQSGPSAAIAHHLSSFAAGEYRQTHGEPSSEHHTTHRAFGQHRHENSWIRDLHQLVHVIGRLDAAARALRALVGRGTSRLDEHEGCDHDERGNAELAEFAEKFMGSVCVLSVPL